MSIFENIVLYNFLTITWGLFSLVFLTILITYHVVKYKITKKCQIKIIDCICIILFSLGTYLLIPFLLFNVGQDIDNLTILESAEKLSINIYEKRMINRVIGAKYVCSCYENDGNKAIKHFEKAISNDFSNDKNMIGWLAYLYALKGDRKNAEELSKKFPKSLNWDHIYLIMSDDYEKAAEVFSPEKNNDSSNFLKAELYKKIGKNELAEKSLNLAKRNYAEKINEIKKYSENQIKEHDDLIKNYQSISAYKSYIKKERKKFGFEN